MIDELPENWASTTIDQFCTVQGGYAFKSNDYSSEGIPLIRIGDLNDGFVTVSDGTARLPSQYAEKFESFILKKGDILIAMSGATTGKMAIYDSDTPAMLNQRVGRFLIKSDNIIYKPYLDCLVKSIVETIRNRAYGGAQPNISPTDIGETEIAIPPIGEQRRIVAKIEELTARSRVAREALAEVPTLLEQFRQSVLAAAFSGDLTADWRAKNPNTEPASELLARIRAERRKQWEAKYPKKKYVEPDPVDDSELPELPEGWCWTALGQVGFVERGRFLVRPRNDPNYFSGTYPFVQIGNLPPEGGEIRGYDQTLNAKGLSVSRMFPSGTALIAIVGATIGNTGLLTFDSCCPDSLVGIQALTILQTRFVELYMRSKKQEIRRASYASGGQPNINLQTLLPYPVPLPPEQEIAEIVRRLDQSIAIANCLGTDATESVTELEMCDQSILAKAFRGELVPQDPNDEPASVLLERLRSSQANVEAKTKPTRKKKSK